VTAIRSEIRYLGALAWPVAATQLSTMLMGTVDTLMVGRVSVAALDAASLANVWIYGTFFLASGIIFGMDPIVAQAHGAGDGRRAGLALQHGIALALLLSVPTALLWLAGERFLALMGQDPALARDAQRYILVQLPSIPCFLVYSALRQYLQGREIVRPALWVILIANVLNAFFNWLLVFGHAGMPRLGLLGAGIATSLTRSLSLLGLALWVTGFGLHRGAWVPWSRRALALRGLAEILGYGLPVAVQMSLEYWAFSGATLIAGLLGPTELAAHTIVLNLAALTFMVPLGISQAAMTRVGNLIGGRRRTDAQRAAWVALGLGAGVMAAAATAFIGLRAWLPRIYTEDAAVIALATVILPIAGTFQVFDGTQVVGCGVLRGMGRTRPAAVFNGVAYWILGLPLGCWLALRAGWGLPGIWWGLCFGLAVVATSVVVWIRVRGPERIPAGYPGVVLAGGRER
jgi:MATE family, multidrug efflux pump